MPLSSGPGSFDRNIRTLMGEVGKSPHVQSRQQALAIAYAKERGKAEGGAVDRLSDRSSSNIEDRRAEAPLTIGQWIAANNPYLPRDYHLYRGMPQAVQRQAPTQHTQARAEGGIVDHDQDEHLPRAQDDARLVRMESAPSGEGPMQLPPGYMAALLRLLRKQQSELYPFYRAWRGGFVGWR